jgi:hypothetical protein
MFLSAVNPDYGFFGCVGKITLKHLIIKYETEGKAIAARDDMKKIDPAISMSCYMGREGDSLAFTATDANEVEEIKSLAKETQGEITYTENFQ